MIVSTIVGLVLLVSAPCPANPAAQGCVVLTDAPPTVYIHPAAETPRFTWWHELGHIWASRTPGAANDEKTANHFAFCHIPYLRRGMRGMRCR